MKKCPICLEQVTGLVEFNEEKICKECRDHLEEEEQYNNYLEDESLQYEDED